MIIDTDQWLSISEFAKKLNKQPQLIAHYAKNGSLETVRLGKMLFIHQNSFGSWPPKRKKRGRPIKQKEQTYE